MTNPVTEKIKIGDEHQIIVFEDYDYVPDSPELPSGIQLYTHGHRNTGWYSRLGEHYYDDQDAVIAAALDTAPNDKVMERIMYDKNGVLDKAESANTAEVFLDVHALCLDVYGYNHSGQVISLTPFGCRWDCGRIGLFAMSRKKARQKYGHVHIENLYRAFALELQPYIASVNQNLMGCWYGCSLKKGGETLDSCYGFSSTENAKEYAIQAFGRENF